MVTKQAIFAAPYHCVGADNQLKLTAAYW